MKEKEAELAVEALDEDVGCGGGDANPAAIETYHPELYRFLLRRLHGAQEAKDLVQDIYLRFLAVPNREKIHQPQRYLYRIAANLVNEYSLRQRRSPVVFSSDQADKAVETESQVSERADGPGDELQMRQRFHQVLKQLPPMYRTVLLLWARDAHKPAEIAAKLGLTLLTTRKYLSRALAEFRSLSRNP